jgi:hypothetical protein
MVFNPEVRAVGIIVACSLQRSPQQKGSIIQKRDLKVKRQDKWIIGQMPSPVHHSRGMQTEQQLKSCIEPNKKPVSAERDHIHHPMR